MLDFLLNLPSGLSATNAVTLFNGVANNPYGNILAFDFLQARWNELNTV